MARTLVAPIVPDTLWSRLQTALAPAYRLERELGGGGMSRVFLATGRDSRLVAVKVLTDGATDLLEARRFRQEIAISTALRHPHVLPVLASGESAGLAWFVTPFVADGSLRDRLNRERRLPATDVVKLLGDVAHALAYAHACGVIHGDLKPENVLLLNGRAVLADFGGARLRFLRAHGAVAADDPVIGTPLYMSPEQAAGETNFDGRADIYALGVMGYELVAGRPPFSGTSPRSILLAHLGGTVPPLREHRDDVPPRLASLIERMLAKDPADRPRSAFVVRTALDGALEVPQTGRERVRVAAVGPVRKSRRRPLRTAALSLGARVAASLVATVVTAGALAAAAGLLTGGSTTADPTTLAVAHQPILSEPTELPRLQELEPSVIVSRLPGSAGDHPLSHETTSAPHAAAMPSPAEAMASQSPLPATGAWTAVTASAVSAAIAGARVLEVAPRSAELERLAAEAGSRGARIAVRIAAGERRQILLPDSLRVELQGMERIAVRELAEAGAVLRAARHALESEREALGTRIIDVRAPCPDAAAPPPAPPDCIAPIPAPATRVRVSQPVGV